MRQGAPCELVVAIVVSLIFVMSLAGCGYKAPLYLPKPKPEGRRAPAIVLPEPAPDRPVPSDAAPPPK